MRSHSRTLLAMLAIVALATLLAFLFNRWRPTPLAWVRTEAFIPAPAAAPAPAQEAETPQPSESSPQPPSASPPAADAPASDQIPAASEPPKAPEATASETPSQPHTPPAADEPTPEHDAAPMQGHDENPTAPETLSLPDALQMQLSGHAVFLDARDPDTYAQGHIPGALCVPPLDLDRLWPELSPLLQGKTVVTYCDGPHCPLSHELAELLRARGVASVVVFVNGWGLWQGEHLPITSGPNP